MNALVRTDEPNSVVATTQILERLGRMGRDLRRGLGCGDPDEDIVE